METQIENDICHLNISFYKHNVLRILYEEQVDKSNNDNV